MLFFGRCRRCAGSNRERIRVIFNWLINSCWLLFKWGLLLGVVGALAGVWFFHDRINDQIREEVQAKIAQRYPDLDVRIGDVYRIDGQGIVLHDLVLTQRGASGPQAELAHFDEILLGCRAQLQDLIRGELDVTHIVLRRPTLHATRRLDGTWSLHKLVPLPDADCTTRPPRRVAIEHANVVIFDPLKSPSGVYKLNNINVDIELTADPKGAPNNQSIAQFKGSLAGDYLGRANFSGLANTATSQWEFTGSAKGIALSPELHSALPGNISQHLAPTRALSGQLAMTFRSDYDPNRAQPMKFEARGDLRDGRIDDGRLPYPLNDVTGELRIDQEGLIINKLTARNGYTQLRMHGHQAGFGTGRTIQLEGKIERLVLDQQLAARLPTDWRETWDRYQPSGEITATFRMLHDGRQWHPELLVDCISMGFTHTKFPYRLEKGTGTISLKNNHMSIQLTAFAGSRPVEMAGEITNPGRDGVGQLVVKTSSLPLDEAFIQATPAKIQKVIRSFHPQGTLNGYVRVTREDPKQPWQTYQIIDLNGISISYDKFPYPLQGVRGRLEGIGHHWTYRDLHGTNRTGVVTAAGQSVPTPNGCQLTMQFASNNVVLDEELRNALPSTMQGLWQRVKPIGRVNISTQLTFDSATGQLGMRVQTDMVEDGITINPDFFPYRMDRLRGSILFQNGRADFANLTAAHGPTQIAVSGNCQWLPGGSWNCDFVKLSVDRIRNDRELLVALPAGLRRALTTLKFTGPLNLRGAARFARDGTANAPVTSAWNVELNTLQGRTDCGIILDQINGGITLAGTFDGQRLQTQGRLDFDSVMYEGFQFTRVQGPMWTDGNRVLFGAWTQQPKPGQPPQRITAGFYGGSLVGDCQISLGEPTRFALNAQLADGDLARFAAENIPGGRNLRGQVFGGLQLQGTSRGADSLQGAGALRMQDGDVYELPLVVSLLKILSVRQPDSTAFNKCDIDFRINGPHVLFDHFNFHGDAVSMLGKGEMDFDQNLRMVFHTILGNDKIQLPLVRPITGTISQQLMLLYVYGTLDNPQTTREALPGVRRAVQEIQGEPAGNRGFLEKTNDWFQELLPGERTK